MKHHSHIGSFLMALAALLASGCFTGDGYRSQVQPAPTHDLDSSIDTIVNDKSTWVDPVRPRVRP
jgi:hypothetical protein